MQVDVQEYCSDIIFKVSAMEGDLCTLTPLDAHSHSNSKWVPYLGNSNGKLFSSLKSNFPDEVLHSTSPGLSLGRFRASGAVSHLSPRLHSSFLYLKGHWPRKGQLLLLKRPKVELDVRPFEAVVWLPLLGLIHSVLPPSRNMEQQVCVMYNNKSVSRVMVAGLP